MTGIAIGRVALFYYVSYTQIFSLLLENSKNEFLGSFLIFDYLNYIHIKGIKIYIFYKQNKIQVYYFDLLL